MEENCLPHSQHTSNHVSMTTFMPVEFWDPLNISVSLKHDKVLVDVGLQHFAFQNRDLNSVRTHLWQCFWKHLQIRHNAGFKLIFQMTWSLTWRNVCLIISLSCDELQQLFICILLELIQPLYKRIKRIKETKRMKGNWFLLYSK